MSPGPAQLMMAFTKDGQLDDESLKKRDKILGKDTEQVRND